MRWPVVLLAASALFAASACGRIFGLDSPVHGGGDGGPDAIDSLTPNDSFQDSTPGGTCIDRWMNGPPAFQPPQKMALDTNGNDSDPFVTSNGLTFVFSKGGDFYYTVRNDIAQPFGSSTLPVTSLNTGSSETKVWVAESGVRAFLSTNAPGGSGGWDLWRGSRPTITDPWALDQLYLGNLNDANDQHDPHLSPDTLRIYYAPDGGGQHIEMASRGSIADAFTNSTTIAALDSATSEADPTLTGNELVIVFSSTRSGMRDLYYATRASTDDAFSTPKPVSALNTTNRYEGGAHISEDGCTLYYEVAAQPNNSDIWVAKLQ